ncbi:MAG: tetratricopeptide repeat protein [Candidatus Omnitrophica bacterium]|nr:tetratricopeptide repeat protein [Candidatus Omnitrophota bacterium]
MQEKSIILEVFCFQDSLKMGILEKKDFYPSYRSFSEIKVDFNYIQKVATEMNNILNKNYFLEQADFEELKKLGHLLFDYLLTKSIKSRLKKEDSLEITLIVDEKLIGLPWELFFTGEDFLSLKFNLGRAITTAIDIESPYSTNISFPLKMLIIANPTGDLKASYKEAIKIKDYLLKNKEIQIDFKSFDVNSLYIKKNIRNYDLLHFAGHCGYNFDSPLKSGWILKDGLITVEDFLLLGQTKALPRLIFANACQSTRTADFSLDKNIGSHIHSLAHAFLLSGCQHYLGCFWKIPDDLATEFAVVFYNEFLKKATVGSALRSARQALIKKYGIKNIAWANYILYGDPGYFLKIPTKKRLFFIKRVTFKKVSYPVVISLILILFINFIIYFRPTSYILFLKSLVAFKRGENNKVFNIIKDLLNKDPDYLLSYKLLGDTYFRLGKFNLAIKNYFEYLRLAQKKKDFKNIASGYLKLAWTHHMKGEYNSAEDFYNKAIQISKDSKDKLNEADALGRMAVYYFDKGNFEKALSLLVESSEINQQRKHIREHRFNLACDYFNLALVFTEMNNYDKAKEFYNKSKELFESMGEISELSDYYFNMGEIMRFEKKYQEALDYYYKGLEIDKKLSHYFNLSSDYLMFGELFWEMGNIEEAAKYFQKALSLCKDIDNLPILASLYYDLGLFYKELSQNQQAKQYLEASLNLYKKLNTATYKKVEEALLSLE